MENVHLKRNSESAISSVTDVVEQLVNEIERLEEENADLQKRVDELESKLTN